MANTGQQEKQQRDVNPTSPTFGQLRYISSGQNLAACPLPSLSYRSAAISQTVYRTDCGAGTSSGATYTVAAGQVVSTLSQTDADAQALAYFNSSAPAYATANTTCSAPPIGIVRRYCQMIGNTVRGQWSGLMVDDAGNTSAPTPQECSTCNGQQDPASNLIPC